MKIAIDGPAGAGKSSLSRMVAHRLKIAHLDTGSMYRAVAYKAQSLGADLSNEAEILNIVERTKIEIVQRNYKQRIFMDGEDVTSRLRTPEMASGASKVSSFEKVRSAMVALQQTFASNRSVVMDGRDIGTIVLPDADFKFYITASPKARGMRRLNEIKRRGQKEITMDELVKQIEIRDYNDMHRKHSPLIIAQDAVVIDTTNMTLQDSADAIINIIFQKNKTGIKNSK